MVRAHNWLPISPPGPFGESYDFSEVNSLHQQWVSIRKQREDSNPQAYDAFMDRLERRWAIETGIIEGIYDIDRSLTQTLVENGLVADLIDRGSTNRDPQDLVRVLRDHQSAAEFVIEHIRRQHPFSKFYIQQLHQILTRNQPTYTAINQFGTRFETPLDHGGFKTQPNNPTRSDGLIHEYCPPIQVDSELDNLVNWYNELQQPDTEYHPLLVGAWLHHRFTQIHPFQDGNGRVARALLTWHLAKEEFLPVVISRDERTQYIESLESADSESLAPFVDLILQIEKQTMLEALGEPEPVADFGLVDQVVDHIVSQIRRQNQNRLRELRSVSDTSSDLRDHAATFLEDQAQQIHGRFLDENFPVRFFVDRGGPNDREHWYAAEVVQTANNAPHWVNRNEPRFWVKLSFDPEDRNRAPRLVFVVSLHHVGRQLTGVMAATAFARIESHSGSDSDLAEGPVERDFRDCTVNLFTLTWEDKADAVLPRFIAWVEESLGVSLRHWSEYIS